MIRPKVFNIFLAALAACVMCASTVFAQGTLKPKETDPLPATVRQGMAQNFVLTFRKASGARIKSAVMSLDTPGGPGPKINGVPVGDDTAGGVDITWSAKMGEPGTYTPTFIVTDADGDTTTYPARDQEAYKFTVENLLIKVGMFVAALLVGLLFLPFLVYTVARSMNQRGDPSGAARVGLLFGVLLCGAAFIYLFASFLGVFAYGIGVIVALGAIVMILTSSKRR